MNPVYLFLAGILLAVSGASYTVEADGDAFPCNVTVNIYRDAAYGASTMIGSGKVSQAGSVVYGGTGCLIRTHVKNGQQVQDGDLLFETMEGTFVPGTQN